MTWPSRCVILRWNPRSAYNSSRHNKLSETVASIGLTWSIPIVSRQYRLLSFRRQAPFSFLLRTLKTTSPASQSGLSSPSPSNTTSKPSGVPGFNSKVYCCVCSTTFSPLQCGHCFLIILPRPPQSLHVDCVCANMPGNICCLKVFTPDPPHPEQVWMSPSDAAPEPRQWSQSIFFLIVNYCGWSQFNWVTMRKAKSRRTSILAPIYLRSSSVNHCRNAGMSLHICKWNLEINYNSLSTAHLLLCIDYILISAKR